MSNIDLNGALSSPSLGMKYYINYYYQGNSMEISASEMGQIQCAWLDKLPAWKHYVENIPDITTYEIDSSDYDAAMNEGKQYGKDLTGYENSGGEHFWQGNKGAGNNLLQVANTGRALVTGGTALTGVMGNLGKIGSRIAGKTVEGVVTETAKDALTGSWFLLAACAFDLASALLYYASDPNKKQYEALMEVNEEMSAQMANSESVQYEIENMDADLMTLNDEANTLVNESNNSMAENKVNYDFSKDTIEYFQSDVTRGYRLTESDVEAYHIALQYMQQSGASISETQNNTQTRMDEIHDDMASYQTGFDDAIDTIGNVEGFTEYAEGFDKYTQDLCYVEMSSQYLAAASSLIDVAQCVAKIAMTCGWGIAVYGAAMAAAGAAAVMDVLHALEQSKMAKDIGNEILAREATQEVNTESRGVYEEYIDYYGGYMTDVEGLNLTVPEDTAPPADTSIPTPAGGNSGGGDGDDGNGKKKKEE